MLIVSLIIVREQMSSLNWAVATVDSVYVYAHPFLHAMAKASYVHT